MDIWYTRVVHTSAFRAEKANVLSLCSAFRVFCVSVARDDAYD